MRRVPVTASTLAILGSIVFFSACASNPPPPPGMRITSDPLAVHGCTFIQNVTGEFLGGAARSAPPKVLRDAMMGKAVEVGADTVMLVSAQPGSVEGEAYDCITPGVLALDPGVPPSQLSAAEYEAYVEILAVRASSLGGVFRPLAVQTTRKQFVEWLLAKMTPPDSMGAPSVIKGWMKYQEERH